MITFFLRQNLNSRITLFQRRRDYHFYQCDQCRITLRLQHRFQIHSRSFLTYSARSAALLGLPLCRSCQPSVLLRPRSAAICRNAGTQQYGSAREGQGRSRIQIQGDSQVSIIFFLIYTNIKHKYRLEKLFILMLT